MVSQDECMGIHPHLVKNGEFELVPTAELHLRCLIPNLAESVLTFSIKFGSVKITLETLRKLRVGLGSLCCSQSLS